jgi:FkbM family methyltransferase
LALPIAVASKRKVIAIDANTQNLVRLSKSAKLNKLDTLYMFRNAVADEAGKLMQIENKHVHHIAGWPVVPVLNSEIHYDYLGSITKTVTFDNLVPLLASLGIKQAILKIDIEGNFSHFVK